ncbi:Actin filament-coating protein tropomyosin [Handroanthus impetiginosus]|uniref:starch synthase n=1 Tax=Handroanthus impetiginosus TaxID=429701 RepID=A0A2G9I115_9LAMI|nr:Actin filament-coating protein tropomyosin [Handroanthus impetiginosus]
MEATPCFLGRSFAGGRLKWSQVMVRLYPSPSQRLFPAFCRMRQRNFSLHNKRQHAKKINLKIPTNTNSQPNTDSESDRILSKDNNVASDQDTASNNQIPTITEDKCPNEEEHYTASPPNEIISLYNDTVGSAWASIQSNDENMSSSFPLNDDQSTSDGGEQLTGIHLQDLIGMIRNAEKNIHLLNQARVRALEDLGKILSEKEALQGEINILEMKLAETDARLKVAAEEKIHVELLEDQLEKLRKELSNRDTSEEGIKDMKNFVSSSKFDSVNSFSEELDLLRAENMSLKDELQVLKAKLDNVKETDQRVQVLEEERLSLESSLKDLELKLAASHDDVSKISSLKSECKSLFERVEDLQALLDKATKQADQAILVLQQNQELRKKVDRLEESLNEANACRISSEKMQQYNELMQQKIKILDERLQKSDEEIQSYVQLYQDSMKEFQDTLNNLKEESMQRAQDQSAPNMPLEFWSNLLLMVDGWFLEKKILVDEAKLLREMIWDKEERIYDAYVSSREKNEREIIATFLKLTLVGRLHVVHIAAEMAPVAKVGGLGDVVTGLSKALQKKGHLVEIVLPKYDCMNYDLIRDLKVLDMPVESEYDGQPFKNKIWVGTVEGLPVYFIEPLHPSKFFWRGQFYGEHDDFKRFSFFSRAALELLHQAGKRPDIIHCHDWQTAFVGGRGLHSTLKSHSKKFAGILNGIDTDAWNPATDPFLKVKYSSNDIEGKAKNKETLRRHLGLSSANVRQPLVACITRLVPQKGVHLIRHAIYRTLELGGQFVLLGSSPVPKIQREFEDIANHFKTHDHARLVLKYDESLSHLIYAASDMLIIPSLFEPCGLTQMIAMRYGSIPIARKTGGLNDSVFDVDDDTIPVLYRNGFTFSAADERAFSNALGRAFYHYNNDGDGWKQLVQKDMKIDFSWDSSASLYEELYAKSVASARSANLT